MFNKEGVPRTIKKNYVIDMETEEKMWYQIFRAIHFNFLNSHLTLNLNYFQEYYWMEIHSRTNCPFMLKAILLVVSVVVDDDGDDGHMTEVLLWK